MEAGTIIHLLIRLQSAGASAHAVIAGVVNSSLTQQSLDALPISNP